MYIYIYIHIHIYIYTYIYIHIHIYIYDGRFAGACPYRNGFRPSRYENTKLCLNVIRLRIIRRGPTRYNGYIDTIWLENLKDEEAKNSGQPEENQQEQVVYICETGGGGARKGKTDPSSPGGYPQPKGKKNRITQGIPKKNRSQAPIFFFLKNCNVLAPSTQLKAPGNQQCVLRAFAAWPSRPSTARHHHVTIE